MSTEGGEVATPNHDPHHVSLMPTAAPVPAESAAWTPVILRAEPEVAAPPAPTFVTADNMLYARANARLRAAPSTAAGVLAKLAANAPLRAIARSTDGAWWQVSLAGKRTAYVHRDAVTKYRVATMKPPAGGGDTGRGRIAAACAGASWPRLTRSCGRGDELGRRCGGPRLTAEDHPHRALRFPLSEVRQHVLCRRSSMSRHVAWLT